MSPCWYGAVYWSTCTRSAGRCQLSWEGTQSQNCMSLPKSLTLIFRHSSCCATFACLQCCIKAFNRSNLTIQIRCLCTHRTCIQASNIWANLHSTLSYYLNVNSVLTAFYVKSCMSHSLIVNRLITTKRTQVDAHMTSTICLYANEGRQSTRTNTQNHVWLSDAGF